MNKTTTLSVLGVVLLGCLLIPAPRIEATPSGRFPFARIRFDCGPTDAIVLYLTLTMKQAECGANDKAYISIMIDRNVPAASPHDYSVGSGRDSVQVYRCLDSVPCGVATSGSLHIEKYMKGTSASGEYEFHFRDGSTEKGHFDATWCATKPICG